MSYRIHHHYLHVIQKKNHQMNGEMMNRMNAQTNRVMIHDQTHY
jgi:hypothetical protein